MERGDRIANWLVKINNTLDIQLYFVATWLTYLTEPTKGGKTCFVQLDIAAEPIARSAVFWYNHLPSGESDDLTRHAACPGKDILHLTSFKNACIVIIGHKWVSNKWIHERGQELHGRQCALNYNQPNNYL